MSENEGLTEKTLRQGVGDSPDSAGVVRQEKWTSGPWESVGATRIWKTGEDGGAVCIIAEPSCEDSRDFHEAKIGSAYWEEAMANAHLIAAAPDLYEALAAYVGLIGNTGYSLSRQTAKELYEAGSAALAKARGEA